MDEGQRNLRRRLRAQGRQLGDGESRSKPGSHEIRHLAEKLAYDQWHRILFARYLLENDLLISPEHGVAVTLDDCEELAPSLGLKDSWGVAASFAAKSLPEIFRADDPAGAVELSVNDRKPLIDLVTGLPAEVFTASDSLGWCYQFWQAEKKDEVNASGNKIGADELPAVTQLFTEPYMVSFLLDNSLGAWWAARRLSAADLKNASSEEELRQKAAIPGVPLEYLRFVRVEDDQQDSETATAEGTGSSGRWVPAAGTFAGWPEQLADLKALDPCCGSGHFLVAAFLMLVPLRMERDGLSAQAAVDAVLRENIHGLELDQRCVELAAFALALAAWKFPDAGGYRVLPKLNVACSGLSVSAKKEEWLALAGDNTNLRIALEELYKQFKDAPVLGSLINPEASLGKGSLFELKWEEVGPLLTQALVNEKDVEKAEMEVVARGLSKSAELLSNQYKWVITNVPYKKTGEMVESIDEFLSKSYPAARRSLETSFLERCTEFLVQDGTCSVVLPQNWLFLGGYKQFRKKLLNELSWVSIARLGAGAFDTISGEHVKAILLTVNNRAPKKSTNHETEFFFVDAETDKDPGAKSFSIKSQAINYLDQKSQLDNPDHRVVLGDSIRGNLLSEISHGVHGLNTKDSLRFIKNFWEIYLPQKDWEYGQTTVVTSTHFGGFEIIYHWEQGVGHLSSLAEKGKAILAGGIAWGKKGISVRQVGHLPCSLYQGTKFDQNCASIVPNNESTLDAIWCFCSSPEYNLAVRRIDQKLNVTNSTLVKVPFDLDHWTKVAKEKYPNGLPKPYTDDPTQWIFHGHPGGSVIWDEEKKWTAHGPQRTDATVLQVAVARLLGYRWQTELDASMELADEQREWVERCEPLLPHADHDGIVCLFASKGEAPAAERLRTLLAQALGDYDLTALLASSGSKGSKSETLESWLRDEFFAQHCILFHHRPFIWHIWDGHKSGFSALVNYHKLTHANLEKLTYAYLGDWLRRQQAAVDAGEAGSDARLQAARMLQERLKLIIEGEPPYDIFVRWKPLAQQAIGWQPDLNDGVRLNIRPFLAEDIPGGKKGAGILRAKPNIKWDKDRGKEPFRSKTDFPWFWNWDGKSQDFPGHGKEPDGNRWNDCHYSKAMKRAARGSRP
ncbi:Eco57I restriction-modification methylase domain-containing protein [Desulfobulbus alkaliphilus]|uniref:Eco57I restriction-modification methylase domain-containing protein n=1 Tax=Desulfobulbus alkaliphilus TaxID=869814 RepID=UPI001F050F9F|nr:N-6 DNA methylase [Desulfobulbus alkaliphilus]